MLYTYEHGTIEPFSEGEIEELNSKLKDYENS